MIHFRSAAKLDKEAALVFLSQEQVSSGKYNSIDKNLAQQIKDVVSSNQFSGENAECFPIVADKKIILLVGVGKSSDLSLTSFRICARRALLSAYFSKLKSIEVILHDTNDDLTRAAIEAILIGTYVWNKYKSKPKESKIIENKEYFLVTDSKIGEETITICEGVNLTRNLINDNADTVTSDFIEKTVKDLVKSQKNISIEILNKKEMEEKGLGLHLAVNQGSPKEPKLIIVRYNGAGKDGDYTALIGKGMTYDTGGLNLKPTGSMETMRTDMSGAAAVVGTLKNTIALGLKKNVIFAMAVAENCIGSRAFKPGDVFRGYAGKTVEIGNTDAEGRLVLADAFAYVIRNYKPKRIIDIATLTGACVIALGHDHAGLVSSDDNLAQELLAASKKTDDRIWRLPIYPELKDAVKSKIADIRNLGYPKGAAGTITAAEFLRQFTEGTTWAHLDIAGTAFNDGDCRWYYGHGATGMGVRLLTQYLRQN